MSGPALVLKPQRIVDGDGTALPDRFCIRLAEGRIAAIGPASAIGGEAASVDLSGLTVMPGFIDLHGYLSVDPDRPEPMRRMFDPDLAGRQATALRHVARNLRSGVTTLRVMGEGDGLDLDLKREIAAGRLPGPELVVCGAPIAPPGSHQSPSDGGIAGVDAMRAAVAERAESGVDFVKLVLTGGVNAAGDAATTALYAEAEVRALFDAARERGLPVAVAAHGGPAVEAAVRLGARTLEHCALFDDADLAAVEHAATLPVLTLSRFFAPDGIARSAADQPAVLARLERARAQLVRLCGSVSRMGIAFGLGTDNMHGQIAEDAALAVRFGLSPASVLSALTGTAARAIDRADRIGFVRVGFDADLVALRGDPRANIGALRRVGRLWRKGREIDLMAA